MQGAAGANGIDGKNTLIKTTTEAAGANCANGGTKIEVGLDTNSNGELDTAEVNVTQTKYICNGTTGAQGTNGLSAYQIWLNAGNTGTESAFLSSLQAVSSSSGGQKMDVFFTSGTFVAPSGVTNVIVELWGAGGGGSTCSGNSGSNGAYGKSSVSVIPGNSYNVVVGQGGGPACSFAGCGGSSSFNGVFAEGGRGYFNSSCPATTSNATFNCIPSNSSPFPCRISPGSIIGAAMAGGPSSSGGPGLVVIYY